MQRCLILILVTIVFAFSALSCSAITFDGEPNNSEWADSEVYALEKPEGFNNSIKSAYMQLKSDTDKNQLYLCITMNVKEVENPLASGIRLTLNKGEEIRVYADGSSLFNKDDYSVEQGMTYNVFSGDIAFEIMLGVKNGIPGSNKLSVVLVDCQGMPSNRFDIEFQVDNSVTVSAIPDKTTYKKLTVKQTKTSKTTDDFTFEKADDTDTNQFSESESQRSTLSELSSAVKVTDGAERNKKLMTVTGVVCIAAIAVSSAFAAVKRVKQSDKEQ